MLTFYLVYVHTNFYSVVVISYDYRLH